MSVVDLKKRSSSDWDKIHECLQSTDSKVFIDPRKEESIGPASMDIEVGDAYIIPGSNESFKIPEEGIKVKPKQAVVLYTRQRFKLPYNIFGVVTGKGKYIFKGCFLSTGKIDPGFEGCLKIGFFNGGCLRITLKPNDVFATVFFLNTDMTISAPLKNYQNGLDHDIKGISWDKRCWLYIKQNWLAFLGWGLVAIPTFLLYTYQFLELIGKWLSQKQI